MSKWYSENPTKMEYDEDNIHPGGRVVSPKIPVSMDADWPWKPLDLISEVSHLES